MITTTDIFSAIATTVRKKFNLKVYSVNTEEGYKPECFFLELISPNVSYITTNYKHEEMSFRLTFFPKTEKNLTRVLEVKNILQELFDLKIKVNDDFYVNIMEQSFTITSNNCLEMLIATEMTQEIDEEDGPMMKEIEIN